MVCVWEGDGVWVGECVLCGCGVSVVWVWC